MKLPPIDPTAHLPASLANQTTKSFPDHATLAELLDERAASCPGQLAVICEHDLAFGNTTLTYQELHRKVNQLAHLLRAHGVGPDQIVGIMVERSFAMIIGILAIIKAGGAYLPISPDYPADRTSYILKDAGVAILLVHNRTAKKASFPGTVVNLDEESNYRGPEHTLTIVNKPTDLAYIIYTSGSNGKPKGVMIEHRSLINRLTWMQSAYAIGSGDVVLQKTPFFFDVSVWELIWFALNGATLCLLAPGAESSPLLIVEAVRKHQVTIMHFVPSMLNAFLEYLRSKGSKANLPSLRQVIASGEALAPSHLRKFNQIFGPTSVARLANLYGPTEATIDVSYFNCPVSESCEVVPIGRPIDNTRFYIMRDGREVAVREVGELCLAGVGLARGYLNNEELTRQKFVPHPVRPSERIYRTGDNARWLPDGNVEYLGREDTQVKICGLRVELGEIENTIRDFPGVADCAVTVKKFSEASTPIVAYIVGRFDFAWEDLRSFLESKLPHYMVPNHFEAIEQIPLGLSGKVDRKSLPEPAFFARQREERDDRALASAI